MRFSLLILLSAVPATAAVAPPARMNSPLRCPNDRPVFVGEKGDEARPKRLAELPPAKLYLSVDRTVNGCREPVIVRYGIGGGSQNAPNPRQ
jgi:hypothetical protein